MAGSIVSTDRKAEATIAKHWVTEPVQREIRTFHALQPAQGASGDFIKRASWDGVLRYAVQRSGMDDYEVADKINISHGYISRVLKGTAGLWGDRMVAFMRATGSIAPLQWLADQMGFELRMKELTEEEMLRARLAELESKRRDAA
jgi:plasmid maintenance system antidote protein VapI